MCFFLVAQKWYIVLNIWIEYILAFIFLFMKVWLKTNESVLFQIFLNHFFFNSVFFGFWEKFQHNCQIVF